MSGWGPSHQTLPKGRGRHRTVMVAVTIAGVLALLQLPVWVTGLVIVVAAVAGAVRLTRRVRRVGWDWRRRRASARVRAGKVDATAVDRGQVGVPLGVTPQGTTRLSRTEQAVLVIGPPRSGKTSGVIVPALRTHRGPVVSTSTKPDVLAATLQARSRLGRVWWFDPTGKAGPAPMGVEVLRWSPTLCSVEWDGALLMARAMVTGARVGAEVTESSHWSRRAQALLAPLLHAAALGSRPITDVLGWVAEHNLTDPLRTLEQNPGTELARGALAGIGNTEARERSSIFSACADALDAYRANAAATAAQDPNFYPGRFVLTSDTVYIHAPAEDQQLAAPLVCGLLAEIRRATYQAHHAGVLKGRMLFALDEVANIAPLEELPQTASEGGSQGLTLLAVLQDLSQARQRWGTAADGFLTLFGAKLILGGVADRSTLESISVALGEYDRQLIASSKVNVPGRWFAQWGHTYSTQRTRVLSPGEIAKLPAGRLLHLDGVRWELLGLDTPQAEAQRRAALLPPRTH
jgi:type IV secretion system protein VirD4